MFVNYKKKKKKSFLDCTVLLDRVYPCPLFQRNNAPQTYLECIETALKAHSLFFLLFIQHGLFSSL